MTDIEIAREAKPKNIVKIAKKLGLKKKNLVLYGSLKAKIQSLPKKDKQSKLVLVTAINPTKSGIGKTTVSIGLADALCKLRKKTCLALREPSLGPVFGIKGGATGGGYSQILPMEDINLHFNGDFHAITSANNLLCSLVDNHVFQGNSLNVDTDKIYVKRCLDLNDRSLRDIQINAGVSRKEEFVITAASEVMAILSMAESIDDLKTRLGNILVALSKEGRPLYARDFNAENAMAILLKDAYMPNLVQTIGGTPAIVHCGPFANIAHGCNSVVATKMACRLADFCITEAGFGADLGAEKFLDFKCRNASLKPNCVVLVATIKALKLHGGAKETELEKENLTQIENGVQNLLHHISVMQEVYKLPLVVTLNKYTTDTEKEISLVKQLVTTAPVIVNDVWGQGADGAIDLAKAVLKACELPNDYFSFAYELDDTVEDKIRSLVYRVYGGKGITFSLKAQESLRQIKKLKLDHLPIIMAKTQFSLSADKNLIGAPKDFEVEVRDIEVRSGAGYLVVLCGNMLLMPALGATPAAINMHIDSNGKIEGIF